MTSPTDIFRDSVNAMLCNLHTCLPGIVVSYDPATNKATIQPALNKNFTSGEVPMPILESVPIMFPQNIKFPVNEGDYVLLLFVERSIDLWLSVGGQVTPTDPRKFDLSDAIAIPGLVPFSDVTGDYNNQDFIIEYQGSKIIIQQDGSIQINTANKVAIGNQTVELLQKISDTLAAIAAITTTVTVPSVPFGPVPFPIDNAASFTTIKGQIDSIKGTIT